MTFTCKRPFQGSQWRCLHEGALGHNTTKGRGQVNHEIILPNEEAASNVRQLPWLASDIRLWLWGVTMTELANTGGTCIVPHASFGRVIRSVGN